MTQIKSPKFYIRLTQRQKESEKEIFSINPFHQNGIKTGYSPRHPMFHLCPNLRFRLHPYLESAINLYGLPLVPVLANVNIVAVTVKQPDRAYVGNVVLNIIGEIDIIAIVQNNMQLLCL